MTFTPDTGACMAANNWVGQCRLSKAASIALLGLLIFLLSGIGQTVLAQTNPNRSNLEAASPKVFMLLWRGMTEAEHGFVQYLEKTMPGVQFEVRDADRDPARIAGFVAEARHQRADLIYSFGTTVTLATMQLLSQQADSAKSLPLVFNIVSDPAGAGLVDAQDDNIPITGASHSVPLSNQLNAILELDRFSRIAALYNPLEANSQLAVSALRQLGQGYTVEILLVPVREEQLTSNLLLEELASGLKRQAVELVYLPSDSLLIANAQTLVKALHDSGLPTFSATESPLRNAGAFIGVVSRYRTVGQLAGLKASQILSGKDSAQEIPIETLKKYSYVVNLNAARQLDYYPPVSILQFAEILR